MVDMSMKGKLELTRGSVNAIQLQRRIGSKSRPTVESVGQSVRMNRHPLQCAYEKSAFSVLRNQEARF